MNRLVIIGNGFDLAHGLPTSYKDFIDDYWKNVCNTKQSKKIEYIDDFVTVTCELAGVHKLSDFNRIDSLNSYNELNDFIQQNKESLRGNLKFEFKNSFFKNISESSIENWVDLENEYYKKLISIVKTSEPSVARMRATDAQKKGKVEVLNDEFEQVKFLFEKYLIEKVEEDYVFSKELVSEFLDVFNNDYYEDFELDFFLKELSKNGRQVVENGFVSFESEFLSHGDTPRKGHMKDKLSLDTYFLCFNYTSTVFEYVKALDISINNLNQIHGKLEDEKNAINFGFGDEMDKHYQEIEEKNDNEYLKNIKSFQYLHTPNYKELLDLIDSNAFQVYIMGHSCGLSDRTLLNTIFEHENCCSIKVFYYEEKDENGTVIKDNYTEITQNISRHFNDKKLMRSKIVNKTFCQPLPQVKFPKYKSS